MVYVLACLFNAFLLLQLVLFAAIMFHVAWRERHGHPYGWGSALCTGLLLVFCGTTIFALQLIPYPYIGFMSWWSVPWLFVSLVYMLGVKARERTRNATTQPTGTGSGGVSGTDGLATSHERARKAFHLAGFLAVLAYYLVGPLLAPVIHQFIVDFPDGYEFVWGPIEEVVVFASVEEGGRYLTLFALVATLLLVTLLDVARLLVGPQYSLVHLIEKRAGRILRDKERGSPGPQVYIATSAASAWITGMLFLPAVPGAMMLALAAIMVSTLADGIAAVVGKARGKHKVYRPFDQVKSLEGLAAGAISAFFISACFTNWILAAVAAIAFLVLDYASPPVADNVINPILITVLLCAVSLVLP